MIDTEKLLLAHEYSRDHLLRLVENLTDEMWNTTPNGGRWSIQRAAVHITNSELFWIARAAGEDTKNQPYLQRNATIDDFKTQEIKVAEIFAEKVREEVKSGNLWKRPSEGQNSYHWALARILQHAIYHTGMISVLRQQVGAPALSDDEETWGPMVDSVFEAALEL